MSVDAFKHAYKNSDIKQLRQYIKLPKLLSTKKFVTYVETSFTTNIQVYDILVLIIFNQYDLTRVISDIIDRDNVDLLEDILSNDYDVELNKDLILKTLPKGRITMAKAIYEYIYDVKKNSYKVINKLRKKYDFVYNKDENSIDSFILAIQEEENNHAINIIPYINMDFWNNFAIKYVCEYSYSCVLKNLLVCPRVDPSTNKNYPLKLVKYNPIMMNELLKHPLVTDVSYVPLYFINEIIVCNWIFVAEKILRLGCDTILDLFKKHDTINLMVKYHNDVTYLAIKLGIFNVSKLINSDPKQKINIKRHLANLKIDDEYMPLPYEFCLDPRQILNEALEDDDVDMAKKITNYSVSISPVILADYLEQYNNTVTKYIYKKVIITYDPDVLLKGALFYQSFEKILKIIMSHNLDFDCEKLYDACDGDYCYSDIILACIKDTYSKKDYEKFLKTID